MQTVDIRLDARWVIPIDPCGALDRHSVLIDGGRIVGVVPTAVVDREYQAREHLRLSRHALIPGLINAHTHAAMALFRGLADDVPLEVWLEQHIWPREGRFAAPDFVYDGTRLAAAEMLKGGITCCNDMYFFPDATARALLDTGMRGMLGLPVLDFPTPYAADPDGYLQKGLAVRDAFKHESHLVFSLAPHAPYTVGDPAWEKTIVYARQLELPIQTHLSETAGEQIKSREIHGATPLARLHRLGATGPSFIAFHAVHLEPADMDLLVLHGGHVVHCPASNMKLGCGIAPIATMIERGINVALGTDGAASNNRQDLFSEMRLAALLAKVSTGNPGVVTAAQVLRAATLGGALALGLDAELGTLAAGKAADVVAVDLGGIATTPCYDPVSHLVYAAGREAVTDVWVEGRRVVADRMLTTVDEAALLGRAILWQEKLQ